jgi:predicted DNA-binding transcriptional regulator YafY
MNNITAISTPFAALATALSDRRPVRISYHGTERLISPHALGWKTGRPLLLAYQTSNTTSSCGWRNFFVDEIDLVASSADDARWRSDAGYNPARPFSSIDEVAFAVGQAAVR